MFPGSYRYASFDQNDADKVKKMQGMDAKACELKEQTVKACTYPDARKCDQVRTWQAGCTFNRVSRRPPLHFLYP